MGYSKDTSSFERRSINCRLVNKKIFIIAMEPFQPLFGSIIFEFVGALSKWIYYLIINGILDRDRISFNEIYNGKKGLKRVEKMQNGMSNTGVGIIVTGVLAFILVWLGI